ncbi:MAG: DUF1702 family protein [bacterium]|nr:DUF1702 family protein [bacterium]
MDYALYIILPGAALAALAGVTGWWRLAFAAFHIRSGRLTVEKLNLAVSDPQDVQRVNTILASFAGGFNATISRPSGSAWRRYCASLPTMFEPFAHEGVAMGYTPRRLFRFDPADFEDQIVRRRPDFRYLYYVGVGFWSGMRSHSVAALTRITERLDPMYRYLCYDGYGFKQAFFGTSRTPADLGGLDGLEGYARNAAHQGVGRALYFLFMDRPDRMRDYLDGLGEFAADAAAGMGLAAVFVNPDRIEVARRLGAQMPPALRDHFHLGMCFGLKARSITDSETFEQQVDLLEPDVTDSVWASIRECDRIELLVRASQGQNGYHQWRSGVTLWLAENVRFPMSGLRSRTTVGGGQPRPHPYNQRRRMNT